MKARAIARVVFVVLCLLLTACGEITGGNETTKAISTEVAMSDKETINSEEVDVVQCICGDPASTTGKTSFTVKLNRKDSSSRWQTLRLEIFRQAGLKPLESLPKYCELEVSLPVAPESVRVKVQIEPGKYVVRLGYLSANGKPAFLSPRDIEIPVEGMELDPIVLG